MTKTNGTEIWPEHLKTLSAAGHPTLDSESTGVLLTFLSDTSPGDADVVVQYAIDDMGFIDTNVFRSFGDRWTEYDPEDGPNHDHRIEWASLAVIMARDYLTNMVLLRRSDAVSAAEHELSGAPHGSLATTLGEGADRGPGLLYKSHGEWIDLDDGAETAYTSSELLAMFWSAGLVWVAPESD